MPAPESRPVVLQALFTAAEPPARGTGFVVRLRRRHPTAVARTFRVFRTRFSKASPERLAGELKITAAAWCAQLHQPPAADFLFALLGYALQRPLAAALRAATISRVRRFNGVYLAGGTGLPRPAWQVVHEWLPQFALALDGRLDWTGAPTDLARRPDRRRPPPRRRKRPSTRQRLFRATLGA